MFGRPTRWAWIVGIAALGLLLFSQVRIQFPSRPKGSIEDLMSLRERTDLNVVFILVDTLRADRLSAYGYARETSPVLANLAGNGVRFANVRSQSSWTKTAMASIWTGTYPGRHRILRFDDAIPDEATLPAERFRELGFTTVGLHRNGWVAPNFGFAQGFDTYVQTKPGTNPERVQKNNPSTGRIAGSDEDITLGAIEFLRGLGQQRFFLYLHYMDVHQYTFDTASARFGTSFSDSYDNAIRWVDFNIGVVLTTLDRMDLLARTVVVIGSDHGEAFLEHGVEGHAKDLYEESVRVPLLFVLPFRFGRPVVVEDPVETVDLFPTLLDLLGMDPLPDAQGRSLLPLIQAAAGGESGGTQSASTPAPSFAQLDRNWGQRRLPPDNILAAANDRHKLILPLDESDGRPEIYDLLADPGEQHDLAELGGRDAAHELQQRAIVHAEDPLRLFDVNHVELDEMRINQLRALGYVVQ